MRSDKLCSGHCPGKLAAWAAISWRRNYSNPCQKAKRHDQCPAYEGQPQAIETSRPRRACSKRVRTWMPPSWTPYGKEFPCKWIFHSFNVHLWPSKTRSQSSRGENGGSIKGTTITPQEYAKAIRNTFLEEMDLGMVINPTDKMQAAELCRCQPDDLCFGSMANVNKLDKIRTISDGSKGGASAQQEVHPSLLLAV